MTQSQNIHPIKAVALVTHNMQLARTVAEVLGQVGARMQLMASGLSERRGEPLPELAILDVDLSDSVQRHELERMLVAFANRIAFVVTSATPTVEGMRMLMRHGIADLLPQPLVAEEIVRAVTLAVEVFRRRALSQTEATVKAARGAVATLLRAGGGAGATAIATQIACAIATVRSNDKVCLLDLDLQFGSAAFHLGLGQRTNLLDLLAAADRLDSAMLQTAMAHHASGVHVLAAPPCIHPLDLLAPDLVGHLLVEARTLYAFTLVDLPLCWTAGTRAALAASDHIVLVVQPSVPSLRHAKRQIETLREEELDHIPLTVIANRVQRGLFAKGLSVKDMEDAIGRGIDHLVPLDPRYEEAVNLGKTLSEMGAAAIAKKLAALADTLAAPAIKA